MTPTFEFEQASPQPVAGVDEVGRGPWAGPVVAAAVILKADCIPAGLNDSKKLTRLRREALLPLLENQALIGIGMASVEEIDQHNILAASMLAMQRAVAALPATPAHALVDGNRAPDLACPVTTIIKGDARCLSIAAASIVAKVTRDRLMEALAREHPGYGWERNAGYGTAEHRNGLDCLGITSHHRLSFRPIAERAALRGEPSGRV
ncbi:MAG: ribonuclease HII [Alphaproteobacteria bacterium]